jgi:hypothetical protein
MIRHIKSAAAALGDALQRIDNLLRTWRIAGLLLLILVLVLAAATAMEC